LSVDLAARILEMSAAFGALAAGLHTVGPLPAAGATANTAELAAGSLVSR
jgi:hypothetical protein